MNGQYIRKSKEKHIEIIKYIIFKSNTIKNNILNNIYYQNPPKIYKEIWVNPKQIKYYPNKHYKLGGLGQIKAGDWDKNVKEYRDTITFKGLKQRYLGGMDWKDTIYVDHYKEKLNRGKNASGYNTIDEFVSNRCLYLDDLYESMEKRGYVFEKGGVLDNTKGKNNPQRFTDYYEPFMYIGRNGEILCRGGNHRRAMAEFLGINKIPGLVLVRHKEWQKERDNMCQNMTGNQYQDHPDVHDI